MLKNWFDLFDIYWMIKFKVRLTMYWIVFSGFIAFELVADILLSWYETLKLRLFPGSHFITSLKHVSYFISSFLSHKDQALSIEN